MGGVQSGSLFTQSTLNTPVKAQLDAVNVLHIGEVVWVAGHNLARLQLLFKIIGGIAVSLLGLARFTEDLGAMVPAKGDGKTTATVRGLCSYGNESKNE